MILKKLKTAVIASLLGAAVMASSATAGNVAVPEEMREMFRAWLLSEPEIIPEAMAVLEERQNAERAAALSGMIAQNRALIFDDGLPAYGATDGDAVTIVKFSDYRCGFCARAHQELSSVLEGRSDVRILVREFPVLGPESTSLAEFALAVQSLAGDAAWKRVHDAIFEGGGGWSPQRAQALAEAEGLSFEEVAGVMSSAEVAEEIAMTQQIARALNVTGTPTFIIGTTLVPGAVPADRLTALIDAELDR